MTRPYPGLSPAATPDLDKMMPALNKMIQGQTGQENDVVLDPAPRDVLRIVEAIGSSGLCKIGVTCQDAVEYDEDGRMQTLGSLELSRCRVYDCNSMYNSMVYRRRPGGRKVDAIVLAVCEHFCRCPAPLPVIACAAQRLSVLQVTIWTS